MVSDPAMLGGFAGDRDRVANDAYFSERECIVALIRTLQANGYRGAPPFPRRLWEPFAGANIIAAELEAHGHDVHASDIVDYGPQGPFWRGGEGCYRWRALKKPVEMRDFLADGAFEPFGHGSGGADEYGIVTNCAYEDIELGRRMAELCLRAALAKRNCTVVWFLLRNEYDLSRDERPDLFDAPHYAMKVSLRWRPQWTTPTGPIVGRDGAASEARHSYAWYGWFLQVRQRWPGARILYADKPAITAPAPAKEVRIRTGKMPAVRMHWQDPEDGK